MTGMPETRTTAAEAVTKITKPIVGYKVVTDEEKAAQTDSQDAGQLLDVDPTKEQLNGAPRGHLVAERLALDYQMEGKERTLYLHVSFQVRKGRYGGEEFFVEHPIEVFSRDKAEELVEAAMVLASQSLQTGVSPERMVKKLVEMEGSKQVLAKLPTGKSQFLSSVTSVIGIGLQLIMQRRGILDAHGNEVPFHERPRLLQVGTDSFVSIGDIRRGATMLGFDGASEADASTAGDESVQQESARDAQVDEWIPSGMDIGQKCPDCETGNLVQKDGCVQCDGDANEAACGYSKCG